MMPRFRIRQSAVVCALAALVLQGCRQDMHDQAKYKPYAPSSFFPDGRSSRPLVVDTVPNGHADTDPLFQTGKVGDAFAEEFPAPVTVDVLARGRDRFNAFCSPCHDRTGSGNGMIVQRGYKQPTSLHADRLRQQAPGYFFYVITNGFGVMPNYAQQIPPADRWAIAAYVRALQLSQHAAVADVPAADRPLLDKAAPEPQPAAASTHHE